ncbi:GapS1 family protein [Alkalimarinus alittae]
MAFNKKADEIRIQIQRYTTESLVNELLIKLHTKHENESKGYGMPWVLCLMLDWTLELTPQKNASPATDEDVYRILNKIWALQDNAMKLATSQNTYLTLRPFLLSQLMFQKDQIAHLFFMVRLFSIMCDKNSSSFFNDKFKEITGLELREYFVFAWYLNSVFINQSASYIPYSELIIKLYPAFSLEKISKLLKLVGATPDQLKNEIQLWRSQNPLKPAEYFTEPLTIKSPILLLPNGFSTPHTYVATIGISEFVIRELKSESFRNKFTKAYEEYIADLFNQFNYSVTREKDINIFYKEQYVTGKVIDFLDLNGGKTVLIDAKGVEPHQKILISDSPRIIKDKLKDSYIKAIEQASECAALLDIHGYPGIQKYEERYAVIVTHQDFYLGNASKLVGYLGDEYKDKITGVIKNKIPLGNIHFVCVEDLEGVLGLCDEKNTYLHHFLDFCSQQNRSPETQKFDVRQHIISYAQSIGSSYSSPVGSPRLLKDNNYLVSYLIGLMKESETYWRMGGEQKIKEFMHLHYAFKNKIFSV